MLGCVWVAEEEAWGHLVDLAHSLAWRFEVAAKEGLIYLDLEPFDKLPREFAELTRWSSFPFRMGVAKARLTARLAALQAAEKGCLVILAKQEGSFLAAQPIEALPLEREALRRLALLGFCNWGQLKALSRADLYLQFNEEGSAVWEWIRGVDERPLTYAKSPSPLLHVQVEWDHWGGIEAHRLQIEQALQTLFEQLEKQVRICSELTVTLDLEWGSPMTLALAFSRPPDWTTAWRHFHERLSQVTVQAPISGMAFALTGTSPQSYQQLSLLSDGAAQRRTWINAIAQHLARKKKRSAAALMAFEWVNPAALLPEQKIALRSLLRTGYHRPVFSPIPKAVVANRHGQPQQVGAVAVASIYEIWELKEQWWTGHPIARSYFQVALTNGAFHRLFCDQVSGKWYRQ